MKRKFTYVGREDDKLDVEKSSSVVKLLESRVDELARLEAGLVEDNIDIQVSNDAQVDITSEDKSSIEDKHEDKVEITLAQVGDVRKHEADVAQVVRLFPNKRFVMLDKLGVVKTGRFAGKLRKGVKVRVAAGVVVGR